MRSEEAKSRKKERKAEGKRGRKERQMIRTRNARNGTEAKS